MTRRRCGPGVQAGVEIAEAPGRDRPVLRLFASGRLSSYYSGEVLAPIGGETLPG